MTYSSNCSVRTVQPISTSLPVTVNDQLCIVNDIRELNFRSGHSQVPKLLPVHKGKVGPGLPVFSNHHMRNRSTTTSPRPSSRSESGTSTPNRRSARFSSSPSFSEVLRRLGSDGSLRTHILKGPVVEGFPGPTSESRWTGRGRGAAEQDTPPGNNAHAHGPPTTRPVQQQQQRVKRLQRKSVPYGGTSVPTSKVASQSRYGGTTKINGEGSHSVLISTGTHQHLNTHLRNNTDTDQGLYRLDQPRVNTNKNQNQNPSTAHLKPQRKSLLPFSDGVPSRGIFSKTKGHYQYTPKVPSRMLPTSALPEPYAKMSDKDAKFEYLEGSNGKAATSSAAAAAGGAAPPLTRGQKVKRHLKKWWWLHLLVLVCIVILAVCLM